MHASVPSYSQVAAINTFYFNYRLLEICEP